jgi:hypothetical protein
LSKNPLEADRFGYELEAEDYPFPNDGEETLAAVQGIWMQMWGGGIEEREKVLSRRLTRTLLPRLLPNSPEITAAVRTLNDAIEELNDNRADLESWTDPFPASPYVDELDCPGQRLIAYGRAMMAGEALDALKDLLRQADQVIEAGDRLVALLPATERRSCDPWQAHGTVNDPN